MITIDDQLAPSITCASDITVSCIEQVPTPDINVVTATDNCLGPITIIHVGDVSDGNTCPEVITRTYRATDACGNSSECIQRITIHDQAPPTITCASDITVSCIEQVPTPDINEVTATDNCLGPITIIHVGDVSDGNTCPQVITRTYRATDACGNSSECIQSITIHDQAPPMITCPADITIACREDLPTPDPTSVITTDNCAGLISVVHVTDLSDGNVSPEVITRTYRATDACGNSVDCSQRITIDNNAPPFIQCPSDIIVACIENVPPVDINSVQAMSSCNWKYHSYARLGCFGWQLMPRNNNPYVPSYGRSEQFFRMQSDNYDRRNQSSPTFVTPSDITIVFTDDSSPTSVGTISNASDDCGIYGVEYNDLIIPGSCSVVDTIFRTWTVRDTCGNFANGIQKIIRLDTVSSFSVFISDLILFSDSVCQVDLDTSNTGQPVITPPNKQVFKDYRDEETVLFPGRTDIRRIWSVWDECGLVVIDTQKIEIYDNLPPEYTYWPSDTNIITRNPGMVGLVGIPIYQDNCTPQSSIEIDYQDQYNPTTEHWWK